MSWIRFVTTFIPIIATLSVIGVDLSLAASKLGFDYRDRLFGERNVVLKVVCSVVIWIFCFRTFRSMAERITILRERRPEGRPPFALIVRWYPLGLIMQAVFDYAASAGSAFLCWYATRHNVVDGWLVAMCVFATLALQCISLMLAEFGIHFDRFSTVLDLSLAIATASEYGGRKPIRAVVAVVCLVVVSLATYVRWRRVQGLH